MRTEIIQNAWPSQPSTAQPATVQPNSSLSGAPAAASASAGWIKVTGSSVNVRAKGDLNATVITRLSRDTTAYAVEVENGWYKILPPADVFGFVAKTNIDRYGNTGSVRVAPGSTLRVRAGSRVLNNIDPSKCEVIAKLSAGEAVNIIGESGEWLMITPPAGVHVYIATEFATRVSDQVASTLGPATTPPASSTPPTVTAIPTPSGSGLVAASERAVSIPPSAVDSVGPEKSGSNRETSLTEAHVAAQPSATPPASVNGLRPAPSVGSNLSGAWADRLRAVEAGVSAEASRPAANQSWRSLLNEIRPIAEQREDPATAQAAATLAKQVEQRAKDGGQSVDASWASASPAPVNSSDSVTSLRPVEGTANARPTDPTPGTTTPGTVAPGPTRTATPSGTMLAGESSITMGGASEVIQLTPPGTSTIAPPLSTPMNTGFSTSDAKVANGAGMQAQPSPTVPPVTMSPGPTLATDPTPSPSGYTAEGYLNPTFAIPAGQFGLRYKLEDPNTRKVRAYIEFPYDLKLSTTGLIGKYVGVMGERTFDTKLEIPIYRVSKVTVLTPDRAVSRPRQ